MVQIKKSSTDELTHSNSFGRVNSSFAKFVVDFLAMSLLFDSFLYHNAQAAPAPWAGRHLTMDEQRLFQQNQTVLIKFASSKMRMLLGSCLVKGSLEQLVGMFPTLTHCGGKVYGMFVS
jgi:hypothetical protein